MRKTVLLMPTAVALALGAHVLFFSLAHDRLQPHYLERSADVQLNSVSTISVDAGDFYGRYARFLLERGAYETPEGPITSHMPGTSILLALSKRLTGNLALYGVVQAGALFLSVIFFCARADALYARPVVSLAALFYLFHPLVLYSSWTVNSDALFCAALLVSVTILVGSPVSASRAALAGSLMGVAGYFREVALAAALGAALALVCLEHLKVKNGAAYLASFLLVLSPWAVRNKMETSSLLLTTSKAPEILFMSSFGLSMRDINPFDADEGGVARYEDVGPRVSAYLAARGFGPRDKPDSRFYIEHALQNYLQHPRAQLVSLGLKLANLLRPPVARRHLQRLLPRSAATALFWALVGFHATLVWTGLCLLFTRPTPAGRVLCFMVLATVAVSLALWAEPRYLLPFYMPLFVLSLNAWLSLARGCRRDHDSPAPAAPAGPTRA